MLTALSTGLSLKAIGWTDRGVEQKWANRCSLFNRPKDQI